jgi:hypothetical protein
MTEMNERCEAALVVWLENPDHRSYGHRASFRDGFAAAVAAERDRCAKICEQRSADHWHDYKNGPAHIRGSSISEIASDEAGECAKSILKDTDD